MKHWKRRITRCISAALVSIPPACAAHSAEPCANVPHLDHPHVTLANGEVTALVFLPNAKSGYYRSTRFDWSGVIGCAVYKGHSYWGEWFPEYDATLNDSITGPVEEFRPEEGAQGYAAAAPGSPFVKIGVGVLRRDSDAPYRFGHLYPLIDTGVWKVHAGRRSIRFEQVLHSPTGVGYKYVKVLRLDGPTISLHHELTNLGAAPIVTDVYDHDFFMLDGEPTGPGMRIGFPFAPRPDKPLGPAAEVEGNDIVYKQDVVPGQTVAAYLMGYSAAAGDYDIRVEDTARHFGVEQTSDSPISNFYLWSIRTTISPEAYIHLDVAPGRTAAWTLRYRLFAGEVARAR